jgi:serpin B
LPSRSSAQATDSLSGQFTDFGLHLLAAVAASSSAQNTFVSPLSAGLALSAVLPGAAGRTKEEIRTSLGLPILPDGHQAKSLGLLQSRLLRATDVKLRIGTSLWADRDLPLRSAYRQMLKDGFDPTIEIVDFHDPAIVKQINGWVSAATEGLIRSVLEHPPSDEVLMLVNAVYFKGQWLVRFDSTLTRPDTFTTAVGTRVTVPFMRTQQRLRYWQTDSLQGLLVPYKGSQFSALIILPSTGHTPFTILPTLTAARLRSWEQDPAVRDVLLRMPRLELRGDYNLVAPLQALGIRMAFDRRVADFGPLSPRPLFVSSARQATYLKVNEEGTEAAAATSLGFQMRSLPSPPQPVIVNRPFILGIIENASGELLFIGTIGTP